MSTQDKISIHLIAIEKLGEIKVNETMRDSLNYSINGFPGLNFPHLKEDWERQVKELEAKITKLYIDYEIYLKITL